MSQASFSSDLFKGFVEVVRETIGDDSLLVLFKQNSFPEAWLDPVAAGRLDEAATAKAYASTQQALQTYFGRGARVTLLRVGRNLWPKALETAPMSIKAQAGIVRNLPAGMRAKSTLELLAKILGPKGQITVHTLDLDLVLVDRASPIPDGQAGNHPACFVTLGLIQGALYWATGHEADVEETSCRTAGDVTCEFRIKHGG